MIFRSVSTDEMDVTLIKFILNVSFPADYGRNYYF